MTLVELPASDARSMSFILSSIRVSLSNLEDRMVAQEEGVDLEALAEVRAKLGLLADLSKRIAAIERAQESHSTIDHLDGRLSAIESMRRALDEELQLMNDRLDRIDDKLSELLDLAGRLEKLHDEHTVLAEEVARLSLAAKLAAEQAAGHAAMRALIDEVEV
jgi:predicted nuclease with TOPRIM domain